jgi:hypothetical protein
MVVKRTSLMTQMLTWSLMALAMTIIQVIEWSQYLMIYGHQ